MLRTFAISLVCILALLTGCHSGPLARPVIIGASAAAGLGSEVVASDGKTYLADMQAVYGAVVLSGHSDPVFLADPSFYSDPSAAAARQLKSATEARPSLLLGIDFLFWPAYGSRPDNIPGGVAADRRRALENSLRSLESFDCPTILGDIPDMRAAIGTQLAARMVPPPDELASLNETIRAWAAAHPNVVIVPLARINAVAANNEPLALAGATYTAADIAGLLQTDHLHPTTRGLVVMLLAGLNDLESRGLIKTTDYVHAPSQALARLPAAARDVDSARKAGGIGNLLSIKALADEFGSSLDKKDCAAASGQFDSLMEQVTRVRTHMSGSMEFYSGMLLWHYRLACPESAASIQRWRDRLKPQIDVSRPDPWPLQIWSGLSCDDKDEAEVVARLVRMMRELGELPKEYDGVRADAIGTAKRHDHVSLFILAPDPTAEVQKIINRAENTGRFWTEKGDSPDLRRARHSSWKFHQVADDPPQSTPQEAAEEMMSIERMRAQSLSMYADDAAVWERACLETGRTDAAAWIAQRFETMVGPESWAKSRERAIAKPAAEQPKSSPNRG